jgi:predicted ATPase
MLTRLKVSGFKNLLDVDVWFGPFTCVAGANGVGKSNLFDAITFLRLLSTEPLLDAAMSIRDEGNKSGDVRSLFFQSGNKDVGKMRFEAEMVTPKTGFDDLRQPATAANTFLRYTLELGYRVERSELGELEILHESLDYFTKGEAHKHLPFDHAAATWRESLLVAKRRTTGKSFISTTEGNKDSGRTIKLHQDKTGGRPQNRIASTLPRTVLSSVNASEAPTVVVARNEMTSWRLLQFEPSALRSPDQVRAPKSVSAKGAHMPAALQHLIHPVNGHGNKGESGGVPDVQKAISQRVSELVDDVQNVWVDEDTKRELLTLHASLKDGTDHPARSLSDGTLRFLALAIIEQTPQSGGLYCLEEPENGIHPERIPAMLKLLRDISTDPEQRIDERDNPLRQVIINTHSPAVVAQVPDESLLIAEQSPTRFEGRPVKALQFSALPDTWRTRPAEGGKEAKALMATCPKGRLLSYLNPIAEIESDKSTKLPLRRVIDRPDIKQFLFFGSDQGE